MGSATRRFRFVHGEIGVLQDLIGAVPVSRSNRNADARVYAKLVPCAVMRLPNSFINSSDQGGNFFVALHFRSQNRKFVSPKSSNHFFCPKTFLKVLSYRSKQFVADVVTEGIIYGLEFVGV